MKRNPLALCRSNRGRCGSLTVEVALCLPILLMVLFGCYEMARANLLLHASEGAAYEGARVGIIPGATHDKIEDAAGSVLRSIGINHFTITVSPDVISADTEKVEVEVAVPFRPNTLFPEYFVPDPTFRGKCELSRETL